MGKPERKARERIGSSSSYFVRCFGISRRFHSDKPIVDVGHQDVIKKKRKMRPHWLIWRPIKFRLKNSQNEITLTPINETEKQKTNVEDDKQNLFRVIRHVTDRKHIAAYGYNNYKAVEHENNPKDKNEEKDINPDPLSLLGNDDKCHEGISTTCRGGKIELTKSVGSGSRSKKKSIRVRKESRVDPIIGILIITLTLLIMLMWGRLCAILCTSTWCYFLPRLKQAATVVVKRKRSNSGQDEGGSFLGYLDLNSQAYKKKVVLEGFLDRQHRISL